MPPDARGKPRALLGDGHERTGGAAGGPSAVLSTLRYAAKTAGIVRGARSLLAVNQEGGFDCPGCAWPDPKHRSTFEFCENGARAVAHEADRRVADAAFFAARTIPSLKGETDHFLEHQGRLIEPLIKRPGSDHYVPIAYEAAFELIARQLRALDSPNEAAFYTSGRTSNEAAFLYQLFARALGTNNLPDCSNMCHESSGKGLGSTLGIGKGSVTLEDFDETDCVLVLGQNPGTNHPRMLTALASAARRGAKIVSINPLRERGLEAFAHPQEVSGMLGVGQPIATHFVRVKINGDVPFLKGVMKELLALDRAQGDVIDRAFLAEHTMGLEALEASLDVANMEELEALAGVDRGVMREIAELYAASERVIACWAMGLTQHKNGVANVREVVNLLLLRGNIGRPGAGTCPVRGHSNVQGDRTMGIHESPSAAFLDRLEAGTGVLAPREHGHDVVGTIAAMEEGRVKVLVALGGNFVAATPDTPRTARAVARTLLSVSVATKLNRSHLETGETALILPCLGRSEIDRAGGKPQFVTVENSMGIVHTSQGNLEPAAAALMSEPAIVAGIARAALGDVVPVRWAELATDYDGIRDLVEKSVAGFDRYNERVRAPGGFALPNGARDRKFATKSGKAELTVQELPRIELRPGEILLMTIRSHDQFNTTVYDLDDRYRDVRGERRVVLMNAEDLLERGLEDRQLVDLTSRFGEGLRAVREFRCLRYDIPRGCAAAYFPEANALVALESFADESRTPASKSIVVRVTPSPS